ncbi:hypothetical protein O181_038510 [Austropuccinia psidii MF-1]|uniref:Integrase catalytic domain-containing protein n=1 Tax=Austropuccinia psidii MF-1 TaxID=1389203 RepID=A0A9Q3D9Y1_9BASI|nr:hypothetical protein [Austropuccinia psidii MF-1]
MFNSPNLFPNSFKNIRSEVATGDSQSDLLALGIGNTELKCKGKVLKLENCLFVPKLKCNLISMLELFEDQLTIQKTDSVFSLSSKGRILLEGEIRDRLMYITYDSPRTLLTSVDPNLWHCRLGHPGPSVLKTLGLPNPNHSCLTCETNKSCRLPFLDHFEPVKYPLDTIHIDVVGPITPESISGSCFLLTIVDQATSYKIIRFLAKKFNSFDQFVVSKNYMENHHDRKIKKLVSNRGGEFLNQKFGNLSTECGFVHIFSPPEIPEHNGFAKRASRTVLEEACCLLNHSNLPNQYWEEAVNTAVFLSNLSLTASRGNKSPYFLWTNSSVKLTKLRTFGCQAVIHSLKRQQEWKLAPPGQEGVLLGFENGNTAYQILRLSDLKVAVTRNATFNKKIFPAVAGEKKSPTWNVKNEHTDQNVSLITEPVNKATSTSTETMENQCSDYAEVPVEESSREDVSTLNSSALPVIDNHSTNHEDPSNQQQEESNIRTHRLKIIGPRHHTLITSNLDSLHILPYSRRVKTFITTSNVPRTYQLALYC